MIFIRAKMPESKLWSEYERLRKSGALPPEKARERASIVEILRGASLKYFVIGTLMCGAYIVSYRAISIFMPTLMIRDLHANFGAVRTVTLIWSAFSAAGLLLAGLASDRIGRKLAVVASTCVCIVGFAAIYLYGRVDYPGTVLSWPLFWCYALWGLGQGSIGIFGPWYSELFPVELRSSATFIGAALSLLFALLLPETAGCKFAVIEGKEHG
jgi:MFS family permease